MAANKPLLRTLPASHLPLVLSLILIPCGVSRVAAVAPDTCTPGLNSAQCNDVAADTASNGSVKKLSFRERRQARKKARQKERDAINESQDWFHIDKLTIEQRRLTPPHCAGTYIEPGKLEPAFRRRNLVEGSGRSIQEQEQAQGKNPGALDSLQLRADSASFDQSTDDINATGNIELRENGLLVRGESALFNAKTGTGSLYGAKFVIHGSHARGGADEIRRESESVTRLMNGEFTQCAPASNTWVMRADEIELDQENNEAKARNAQLRLWDVPVFWSPYLAFPLNNQRRSGLLFPNVSTSSSSGGLDFTVPYYFNIAPAWDATVAPRYIAARGIAIEAEGRHLNRYSEWVTSGSWIDDKEYGDKRWLFAVKERGNLPGHWSHRVDYTQVSDEDYLSDLSGATSLDYKRSTNLEQSVRMEYRGRIMDFEALFMRYQIIDVTVSEQYKRLPQLSLNLATDALSFKPNWLLKTQLTQFGINDTEQAQGGRFYLEPGFSYPMITSWGYLTPTVKAKSVFYALDESHDLHPGLPGDPATPVEDPHPATLAPMFSVDSGLHLNRPTDWFGRDYTQTFEPRLYYLYTRYEDQSDQPLFDTGFTTFDYHQLFRESRFTGYDRIADANQVSLGLTTRLIQDMTGSETIWASIGQIYYFDDRRVNLNQINCPDAEPDCDDDAIESTTKSTSQFAALLGYQWSRNLRSYVTALYDTTKHETDQAGLQIRYLGDQGLILNLAQHYRLQFNPVVELAGGNPTINQTDFSGLIPVTRHWAILGRYNYDYTNTRVLSEVYGMEYNSCCWKFRLVYQSGLDTDLTVERGLYFQFVLKGLGGADTGVRSVLNDSIVGFENYEDADRL